MKPVPLQQRPLRTLGRNGPRVSPMGLGLAALGRPAYMTVGHADDLRGASSPAGLRARSLEVMDAAYAVGVRYFDVARSYGLGESFLRDWLERRAPRDVVVGSKWGYRYTANWDPAAAVHEIKEHSLEMLRVQWRESRAELGDWLSLYQIHSASLKSGVLEKLEVLRELGAVAEQGVRIGLSVTGPEQAETLRRALEIRLDGRQLFSCVQATWNLLERSVGPALAEAHGAGWGVIIKEALANGRLADAPGADGIALAAVLRQPFVDVVLSGAATVEQVRSNARALEVADADVERALAACPAQPPAEYWGQRAQLAWT